MQKLHPNKNAIYFGMVALLATASAITADSFLSLERNESEPKLSMPTQEDSTPEMIVSGDSPSIGMPVPNTKTSEMIIIPN